MNKFFKNISKKALKTLLGILFVMSISVIHAQNFIIHKVEKGETVKDIARSYQLSPSQIYKFNENIKPGDDLKEGMTILIPKPETQNIPVDSIKVVGKIVDYKYHTVGENETVYGLSKKYHSKIEAIKKLNKIEGFDIKLGQILIIPIYADENYIQNIDTLKYTYYIVQPKQGKWRVAYDHGITIDELERLNPAIKDRNLLVGQKLVVPKYRPARMEEVRDEKNFIYHVVQPHETLFSLAKKFHTSQDKIKELNPQVKDGLKTGQTIKFDRKEFEDGQQDFNKYVYHQVQPKETLFSLAKQFDISQEKIIALNPVLKDGLKTGQIIRFPKKRQEQNKDIPVDHLYVYHTVQPLETLFGLARQFGVSQEEILKENPIIKEEGLKTGQIIKIKKSSYDRSKLAVKDSIFPKTGQLKLNLLDSIKKDKNYKLAVLLPFKIRDIESLPSDDKCEKLYGNMLLDYYSGIKLAIDSLKTYGMKISYDVFDTQASPFVTGKILETTDLSEYDFVIGPLKTENIDKVATVLELDNTPQVVNKYKGNKTFRNLIVTTANNEGLQEHLINYLNERLDNNKQLTIIYDETKEKIADTISSLLDKKAVLFKAKKTKKGFTVYINDLSKKLAKDKENYVLLISDDTPLIFTVLSSLNSLNNQYKITFFTLDDKRLYEDVTNDRTNMFLSNLNYHFPSKMLRLLDDQLKESFISHYHTMPGFAAVNGFDTTFDLLLRAGNADNLFEGLQKIGQTRQTSKVFLYEHQPDKGFKNKASVILRLNKDLRLEVVD